MIFVGFAPECFEKYYNSLAIVTLYLENQMVVVLLQLYREDSESCRLPSPELWVEQRLAKWRQGLI